MREWFVDWFYTILCIAMPASVILGALLIGAGHPWGTFFLAMGAVALVSAIRGLADVARHGVHNDR